MAARGQAAKGARRHPEGDPRTSARRSKQGVPDGREGGQVGRYTLLQILQQASSAAFGLRILQQQQKQQQ